jgi:hypothetical protein
MGGGFVANKRTSEVEGAEAKAAAKRETSLFCFCTKEVAHVALYNPNAFRPQMHFLGASKSVWGSQIITNASRDERNAFGDNHQHEMHFRTITLMQPIAMQRRKRDDVVDQKFML